MTRIVEELLATLYSNVSPYSASEEKYIDHGYPHTNILADLLKLLFKTIEPVYIVECGSMVGGSAIRMAQTSEAQIVCIDPFTGDVNMWDWERNDGWKFLRLENGIPTIYKRFLANCKEAGFEDRILPINCTTNVGIKLLQRLKDQEKQIHRTNKGCKLGRCIWSRTNKSILNHRPGGLVNILKTY